MDIDESFGYFARKPRKERLFLNMYNEAQLLDIMKGVGLVAHLKTRGFNELVIDINQDETLIHYLRVYFERKAAENLLIDVRLSDSRFVPDKSFFDEGQSLATLDMIVIEWLSIQDPRAVFSGDRPQLPGQSKPGLGCLQYLMKMMYIVAEGVIKDGFMDVPDHMHGAVMYSKKFKFFNPAHEGILRAILRDAKGHSLRDISWGMLTGTIIDTRTGQPQVYDPSEQIYPVSKRIIKYFVSKRYVKRFNEVYTKKKYSFDYEKMVRLREEIIKTKKTEEL
ncbi:MAG TPA: hypothetical protein VLM75_09010 [Spirochaetota bacterium]|nr:hypothetical protein [Spirochaetota bacterium]